TATCPLHSHRSTFPQVKPQSTAGVLGDFRGVAGRNGSLRSDHPYVSAVAVVRREDHAAEWASSWFDENRARFGEDAQAMVAALAEASQGAPEGDDLFPEIFETLSTEAVPLPREVFNGPRDRRWIPNTDRTALIPMTV
ncbi:hypothetical protein, partial [Streptomyces sp. AP-93]|uniref:hypothetical protein n=1 Tax=Streptomyces sp. AP-93 TaxID=2929048 RepID=UPI001FAE894B